MLDFDAIEDLANMEDDSPLTVLSQGYLGLYHMLRNAISFQTTLPNVVLNRKEQSDGSLLWVLENTQTGAILDRSMAWVTMPDNISCYMQDFIKNTRFTWDEAMDMITKFRQIGQN